MSVLNALAELPPVAHGYYRVLRVGGIANPQSGGCEISGDSWADLRCPHVDGIDDFDRTDYCAVLPHQFRRWWDEERLLYLMPRANKHLVALDVPHCACKFGRSQVAIKRDQAVIVAVLMH